MFLCVYVEMYIQIRLFFVVVAKLKLFFKKKEKGKTTNESIIEA